MIWNEVSFFLSLAFIFIYNFCFQKFCNILASREKTSCGIQTLTNRSYLCKLKSFREGLKDLKKKIPTHSFLSKMLGRSPPKKSENPFCGTRRKKVPIKATVLQRNSSVSTYCKPHNNHKSTKITACFSSKTVLADLIHITVSAENGTKSPQSLPGLACTEV